MISQISGSSTVVAARDQVSCDLGGEAAILDMKSGIYYGLDAIGAQIWNLIQEPKTVDEISAVILAEYDVETDRCQHDIVALLQDLMAHGLVELHHGTDS
jgi:hypothetical protein